MFFIRKLTIKSKNKIKHWNIICVAIAIISKTIKKRCFSWFSTFIIALYMRSLSFHHSKSSLKLKQIFNLIETMTSVRMYSLQEIAFNYYKMSVINLFSVSTTRKSRKRAFTTKKSFQKVFRSKIKSCCSQKI